MSNGMRPVHPGEVLREDYLTPLNMSDSHFANETGIPIEDVTGILAGQRAVTTDIAARLAKTLGTSPEFWLNLQKRFELRR